MTTRAIGDAELVVFLQWALPQRGLRWRGFRRVRRQVGRRIRRRMEELGIADLRAYRAYLQGRPAEWEALDNACRVTISRFFRDRAVFDSLRTSVLPALAAGAAGEGILRAWSVGCASGEEPWSLALLWQLDLAAGFPALPLAILATDADEHLLERARRGVYPESSLLELPAPWRAAAFERVVEGRRLRDRYRKGVTFRRQDVRHEVPAETFHLVLCRNLAFTYYGEARQREVARCIADRLRPAGALVVGVHEALPTGVPGFVPWDPERAIYRRSDAVG